MSEPPPYDYQAAQRVHQLLCADDLLGPPCEAMGTYGSSTYRELVLPPESVLAPRTRAALVIPPHTSHTVLQVGLDVELHQQPDADVQAQLDRVRDRITAEPTTVIVHWIPLPGARMQAALGPYVPRVAEALSTWVAAALAHEEPDCWTTEVEIAPTWERRAHLQAIIAIDPEGIAHRLAPRAHAHLLAAFPELAGLLVVDGWPYK